jgi:hypothetical protein
MKKIKLVDPGLGVHDPDKGRFHQLVVPALERHGIDSLVSSGQIIEVPPDVAGVAPYWRAPKDGDDMPWLISGGLVRRDEHGAVTSVHDLGYGLLSQVGIWEAVTEAPAKTQKQEG